MSNKFHLNRVTKYNWKQVDDASSGLIMGISWNALISALKRNQLFDEDECISAISVDENGIHFTII